MTRNALLATIALGAFAAFGCDGNGGSSPTTTQEVLQGTYILQSSRITGNGIDIIVSPPAVTGSITATADGRFTATFNAPEAGFTDTFSGSYALSGDTLTLFYDDGSVEVWTISGDRRTLSGTFVEEGLSFSATFAMA